MHIGVQAMCVIQEKEIQTEQFSSEDSSVKEGQVASNNQAADLNPMGPQTVKAKASKAFDLTIDLDEEGLSKNVITPSTEHIEQRKQHFEEEYQKKRDPMGEFFQLVIFFFIIDRQRRQ